MQRYQPGDRGAASDTPKAGGEKKEGGGATGPSI